MGPLSCGLCSNEMAKNKSKKKREEEEEEVGEEEIEKEQQHQRQKQQQLKLIYLTRDGQTFDQPLRPLKKLTDDRLIDGIT